MCKFAVTLIVLSLLGQAIADPCDVFANTISGQCKTFEKTIEIASKEFKATLKNISTLTDTVANPLRVSLSFGNCKFEASVYESKSTIVEVEDDIFTKFMNINGSESGINLRGAGSANLKVCQSLAFQAHEKSYRLPFAWSISQPSSEISLTFEGSVKFVNPDDIKPGLSNSEWVGIGISILAVLILLGVGIVIAVYCKCKKRGKNIPKGETKPGELQLDKTQPSEKKLVKLKPSNKKSSKAKPFLTYQRETAKKQEIVKKVKSRKVPRSIAMQELEKPSQEKTASKEPATIEPIRVDQLEVHAKPAGAKLIESQGKLKLLNDELDRQIQSCGCRKRTGKLCNDCSTAVPKTLTKQSSSSSSGSKTTQDKN